MQKKVFKKEHFMSIIGFYGNTALVDKKLASQVKNVSVETLLKKGLLFPAVCSVFYAEVTGIRTPTAEEEKKFLCDFLNVDNFSVLVRRFGVHEQILMDGAAYSIKFV